MREPGKPPGRDDELDDEREGDPGREPGKLPGRDGERDDDGTPGRRPAELELLDWEPGRLPGRDEEELEGSREPGRLLPLREGDPVREEGTLLGRRVPALVSSESLEPPKGSRERRPPNRPPLSLLELDDEPREPELEPLLLREPMPPGRRL